MNQSTTHTTNTHTRKSRLVIYNHETQSTNHNTTSKKTANDHDTNKKTKHNNKRRRMRGEEE
eukprot:8085158-Pyramimonas_sp.AAC.1